MAELPLTLTDEERRFLVGLLELVMKDTLTEEHRTRTLSYREYVLQKEDSIVRLLSKPGQRAG
jgi:hypothetical protein